MTAIASAMVWQGKYTGNYNERAYAALRCQYVFCIGSCD
jgi:hypothetical protein